MKLPGRTVWVALLFGSALLPLSGGADRSAVQADQVFTRALSQHDKAAASALLDAKFEWTNANGQTHSKAVSLEDFDALATDNDGDADVEARDYGQLALVAGRHHGARFSRIWVKRPAGWKAYLELDTPLPSAAATRPAPSPGGAAGDCDNPCRSLPFTPVTAADKAVLAEWQKTKMDEWHPDAADWATHITDDFRIINDRSERNKDQRVALAKDQQAAGAGVPGDPVLSMRMADFETRWSWCRATCRTTAASRTTTCACSCIAMGIGPWPGASRRPSRRRRNHPRGGNKEDSCERNWMEGIAGSGACRRAASGGMAAEQQGAGSRRSVDPANGGRLRSKFHRA